MSNVILPRKATQALLQSSVNKQGSEARSGTVYRPYGHSTVSVEWSMMAGLSGLHIPPTMRFIL